jgi:hypothetical protein
MGNGGIGMNDLIEQRIIEAVRKLLTGRVNELLASLEYLVPLIEFSDYQGGNVVVPVINLSTCERSEKERIILLDAYSLSITFSLSDMPESEFYCYVYAISVCKALGENPTLDGVADRVVVTGKRYNKPKKPGSGEGWGVEISLRVTIETMSNEKGGMNN